MKKLKRVSVLAIALLAMAPAAWSQTAKEVLTKVFENVEKNYNLADVYKRYDAKYVCFIDGKMKHAFKQDVILNYPKESAKLSEMVWYSNKSYPSKRLRFKALNIDVVRNMYGSFIKDSERFFTSMDSLTLNEEGNRYVVSWVSNGSKGIFHTVLHVDKDDFAVVGADKTFYRESNKKKNLFRWFVVKQIEYSTTHTYGKQNGRYELLSFTENQRNVVDYAIIGEDNTWSSNRIDFSGYCDKPNNKKNSKESISHEEASELAAEIIK